MMKLETKMDQMKDQIKKIDRRILSILSILIILSATFFIIPHSSKEYNGENFTQSNIVLLNSQYNVYNGSDYGEIRFVTVGDPHIKHSASKSRGNERLQTIVNFVNNRTDVDFMVLLGDVSDDGKNETFNIVKNILSGLNKPYFMVAGNHDIFISRKEFESNFGSMERIENIKGYQLLFIGISNETTDKGKVILHWTFDFNKTNKSAPTLVFLHGTVQGPPPDCTECNWGPNFFRYGQSMLPELNKFTDLIGVYSGHVHYTSEQIFNNTEYITLDGLIAKAAGGIDAIPSEEIGYSMVNNSKLEYHLVTYE